MPASNLVSLAVALAAACFAGYSVFRVARRLSSCDYCGGSMDSRNEGSCAVCGTDACTRCLAALPGSAPASGMQMSRLPMCPTCRAAIATLAEASLACASQPETAGPVPGTSVQALLARAQKEISSSRRPHFAEP